jgi:hypothetical protein
MFLIVDIVRCKGWHGEVVIEADSVTTTIAYRELDFSYASSHVNQPPPPS